MILEAYHRAHLISVTGLWALIDRCCVVYPRLTTETRRPEIAGLGRLILQAWRQREEHLQQLARDSSNGPAHIRQPDCVVTLYEKLQPNRLKKHGNGRSTNIEDPKSMDSQSPEDSADVDMLQNFDLDAIDWTFWLNEGMFEAGG